MANCMPRGHSPGTSRNEMTGKCVWVGGAEEENWTEQEGREERGQKEVRGGGSGRPRGQQDTLGWEAQFRGRQAARE